jgi:hypothetical protein
MMVGGQQPDKIAMDARVESSDFKHGRYRFRTVSLL